MRRLAGNLLFLLLFSTMLAGCGGVSKNLAYFPGPDAGTKISKTAKAVVLPVRDSRKIALVYPKQIIAHTSYYGEKSFDINDRPVDQVFRDALSLELYNLGLGLVKAEDIGQPLDKQTKDAIRKKLMESHPEVKAAFGLNIRDFMANSTRNFLTTDVEFSGSVELSVLDVATGDLYWYEFKASSQDTVLSADRNYMVEELSGMLADIMQKTVRDNLPLRDTLVKIANR